MEWIQARLWMLGTIGAGLLSVGLGISLAVSHFEIRHLSGEITKKDDRIASLTSDLAQSRTNADTLQAALDRVNAQITTLSAEGAQRVNTATEKLAAAQQDTAVAQQRAGSIMAFTPTTSASECEKMLEVDRKFVEMLK